MEADTSIPQICQSSESPATVETFSADLKNLEHVQGVIGDLVGSVPTTELTWGNHSVPCVLDTGSETSLISSTFFHSHLMDLSDELGSVGSYIKLFGVSDVEVPIEGYLRTSVVLFGNKIEGSFLVKKDSPSNHKKLPIIVECNILRQLLVQAGLQSDSAKFVLSVIDKESPSVASKGSNKVNADIYSSQASVIAPRSIHVLQCSVEPSNNTVTNEPVLVESTTLFPHLQVSVVNEGCHGIRQGRIELSICNNERFSIMVPSHMLLGTAIPLEVREEVSLLEIKDGLQVSVQTLAVTNDESPKDQNNVYEADDTDIPSDEGREEYIFPSGEKYVLPKGVSLAHVPPEYVSEIAAMFRKREKAFSNGDWDLGRCDLTPHKIHVKDDTPISLPYRRISPHQVLEVKAQLQGMLDKGIIRRSSSPYGSLVVVVKKKSGAYRICVDYRQHYRSELDQISALLG